MPKAIISNDVAKAMISAQELKQGRTVWTPQPRQAAFLARPEYEALYGGAAGGGKTDSLLMWLLEPFNVPTYKGLLLRKTFPELEQVITRSDDLFPRIVPGARYNDNKHVWRFPSGARIYFGSNQRPTDIKRYQGQQYERVGFDEGTHFLFSEYSYLFSRNRPNGPNGLIPMIRMATNPGGIGHAWVHSRFIANRTPGQSYFTDIPINGKIYRRHKTFIPATVWDNQELLRNDPNYVASLAMLPEATRDALLNGEWSTFSGQAFTEWANKPSGYQSRRWTHVVEPYRIPANWRIFRSFDWGYSKPFSCHWWAMNNDGLLTCIRELYGCTSEPNTGVKWHPGQIAKEIKRIETEEFKDRSGIRGIADPSIWDASRGESIAAMMENEGVFWSRGDNERIAGKMQVHYRLAFDDEGLPMVQFFNTCKHIIRTLPSLVYDQTNVEDIDSDGEDHAYDDFRYLMMDHPIPARTHHRPPIITFDPLNLHPKIEKPHFFTL
jgi:hypothetical protein